MFTNVFVFRRPNNTNNYISMRNADKTELFTIVKQKQHEHTGDVFAITLIIQHVCLQSF